MKRRCFEAYIRFSFSKNVVYIDYLKIKNIISTNATSIRGSTLLSN